MRIIEGSIVVRAPNPRTFNFVVQPTDSLAPSVTAGCGHRIWRFETVTLDNMGHRANPKPRFSWRLTAKWLPRFLRGEPPALCSECHFHLSHGIVCATCGMGIFPGDQVQTVRPDSEHRPSLEWRHEGTLTEVGNYVVCARPYCSGTGYAVQPYGTWLANGTIEFPRLAL